MKKRSALLIACGALGREIVAVLKAGGLEGLEVTCLPAHLHNTPKAIPDAVRGKIRAGKRTHDQVFVLYGDCGTGGELDLVCAEEGASRIGGAHCYEFFAGSDVFAALTEVEPAAFYLTDFLVRHFQRLVIEGLGLDRHPELLSDYFGNYRRLIYLAQTKDAGLEARARVAAARLGLEYDYRFTGYGGLETFIREAGSVSAEPSLV